MSIKKTLEIEKHFFGTVPKGYPITLMRGCKVYDSALWNRIQNTIGNIKRKEEAIQKYYGTHNYQRNIAEELGFVEELDKCVENGFDIQLKTLYPEGNRGGINTECSHWEHKGKAFTEYLRGQYFTDEIMQYSKEALMVVIPDELSNKMKI